MYKIYTKTWKVEGQCDKKYGTHQCDTEMQISKEKCCVIFGWILRIVYGRGTEWTIWKVNLFNNFKSLYLSE